MKYEEKRVTLADGTIVFLRSPLQEDAQACLDYLSTVTEETRFLSAEPGERQLTLEMEENWVLEQLNNPRQIQIGAFKDGQLVGMAGVEAQRGIRRAHRATLGIAIIKEFWHLGLGTMLMREAISAAQRMGYQYLDLAVVKQNERAVRLYEKYGFSTYGELQNAFRYPDGTYMDECMMTLELGN